MKALGLCTAGAGLYWVKLELNLVCTWNQELISVLGLCVHLTSWGKHLCF